MYLLGDDFLYVDYEGVLVKSVLGLVSLYILNLIICIELEFL